MIKVMKQTMHCMTNILVHSWTTCIDTIQSGIVEIRLVLRSQGHEDPPAITIDGPTKAESLYTMI